LDDLNFRAEFRRALDPLAPPAPWLESAVRDGLRRRRRLQHTPPGGWRGLIQPRLSGHSWLWPGMRVASVIMAVIVLVAAMAAFLAVHRASVPTAPVHFPPFHVKSPGAGVCSGTCNVGYPMFVSPDVGFVVETGHSQGTSVLFRTDDGGLTWNALHASQSAEHILASSDAKELLMSPPSGGLCVTFGCYNNSPGPPLLYSGDGGVTWSSHGFPSSAGAAPEVASYFLNPHEGWVLFQDGELFHTSNGGARWARLALTDIRAQLGQDLSGGQLFFANSGTAWYVANPLSASSVDIFRSLDGGVTWRRQNVQPPPISSSGSSPLQIPSSLKFFNDREGVLEFVAQQNGPDILQIRYVYTTSDGGDHWSAPLPAPNVPYERAVAIRYLDLKHWVGWPMDGGWYSTADGGQHWKVTPAPGIGLGTGTTAPGHGLPGFVQWTSEFPYWFDFLTPSQGWALLASSPPPGSQIGTTALYQTNDGGVDWTPLSLPELG
jgi:photosystem II stability/assembly factor-like uncharacterized protein